tara:strand:- start:2612 stop:2791 length:180 start_codon:yes stop_codon:yes gene_type:complete
MVNKSEISAVFEGIVKEAAYVQMKGSQILGNLDETSIKQLQEIVTHLNTLAEKLAKAIE